MLAALIVWIGGATEAAAQIVACQSGTTTVSTFNYTSGTTFSVTIDVPAGSTLKIEFTPSGSFTSGSFSGGGVTITPGNLSGTVTGPVASATFVGSSPSTGGTFTFTCNPAGGGGTGTGNNDVPTLEDQNRIADTFLRLFGMMRDKEFKEYIQSAGIQTEEEFLEHVRSLGRLTEEENGFSPDDPEILFRASGGGGVRSVAAAAPGEATGTLGQTGALGLTEWERTFAAPEAPRRVSFTLDSRTIRALMARKSALGVNMGAPGARRRTPNSPYRVWLSGAYGELDAGRTGQVEGHLGQVAAGIAWRASRRLAVGAHARYRDGAFSMTGTANSLDATSAGVGVSAAWRIAGHGRRSLMASAGALYDRVSGSTTLAGARGEVNADQYTVFLALNRRWYLARRTWVNPRLRASYSLLDRDAIALSNGTILGSDTIRSGSIAFAPEFNTVIATPGAGALKAVRPRIGASVAAHFDNVDDVFNGVTVLSTPDSSLGAHAGIDLAFTGRIVTSLDASYRRLDTSQDVWSVAGSVRMPLATLGMGGTAFADGTLGLSMQATGAGPAGKLRVRIPLH